MVLKIDVIKFENEVIKYNELIKKYESVTVNLFHILKNTSSYWRDDRTNIFFDELQSEKRNIDLVIDSLKELGELYKFMLQKYKDLGNKITYNPELKKEIDNKFSKLTIEITDILKKYNNLNIDSSFSEKDLIANEKNNIIKAKEKIEDIKEKVKDTFQQLDNIDNEINQKIKNMDVKKINENDILSLI